MNNRYTSPLLLYVKTQVRNRGRRGITPLILQKAVDAINNILINCCTYQFASRRDVFLNTVFTLLRTMDKATDRPKLREVRDYLNKIIECCQYSAEQFTFTVDNSDEDTVFSYDITSTSSSINVTVDWGDGTKNYYSNATSHTLTHTYTTADTFDVVVTISNPNVVPVIDLSSNGDDIVNNISAVDGFTSFTTLTTIDLSGNKLTEFDPATALPETVTSLDLSTNSIAAFDPTLALPDAITTLNLSENALTAFDPTIALPTALTTLDLSDNDIAAFDPTIALPEGLTTLDLGTNALTAFAPAEALPETITQLSLNANTLDETAVNAILVYLDAATFDAGVKNLDVTETPTVVPSGAGATAQTSLVGKGWVITL